MEAHLAEIEMTEQSLFDTLDRVQAVPRSASGDAPASERAENKMRESGKMRGQALAVLTLVKRFPGYTSKELASESWPLDRYQLARRLPELLSAGLVTRTDEKVESRWWPVELIRENKS